MKNVREVDMRDVVKYFYQGFEFEDGKKPVGYNWYYDSHKNKMVFIFHFEEDLEGEQ